MEHLKYFWGGCWRGGVVGGVYSFAAMLGADWALSIGLSTSQSLCLGVLIPQLVMMVMYHLHFYSLDEVAKGQANSQLIRELLIKVLK